MSKYCLMVKGSPERWVIEDVITDHQLGCYLLQKVMQSRDCVFTKDGVQKFVKKVLTNDNNSGLYPDIDKGIGDIAIFITDVFSVYKMCDGEPIGKRRRKHLKYIIKKTLDRSVLMDQKIRAII